MKSLSFAVFWGTDLPGKMQSPCSKGSLCSKEIKDLNPCKGIWVQSAKDLLVLRWEQLRNWSTIQCNLRQNFNTLLLQACKAGPQIQTGLQLLCAVPRAAVFIKSREWWLAGVEEGDLLTEYSGGLAWWKESWRWALIAAQWCEGPLDCTLGMLGMITSSSLYFTLEIVLVSKGTG